MNNIKIKENENGLINNIANPLFSLFSKVFFFSKEKKLKGISPLIASVLLIAFTMAIAGIMASWATTFSSTRLGEAASESNCIGALDISSLSFSNANVSVRIRNVNDRINLTDIKVSLIYSDPQKSNQHKDISAATSLSPLSSVWFINNTGDTERPKTIEVIAMNCPKYPAILNF